MKKYIIALIATLFLAGGCADLDVQPEDRATAGVIFQDFNSLRNYLAKIYGAYILTGQDGPAGNPDLTLVNDEGFTSYIRAYWKAQQLPTDETVIAWTDAGIQDLNTLTWSSENQFVKVLYYRLFLIISLSNDFLAKTSDENLQEYGYEESEIEQAQIFRAEVRFLRALAYWHALDLFRNVPLVTRITTDPPAQSSPEDVFSFIESELNEIESTMIAPQANEYGRADRAALWTLQAKLFLNAEVYVGQDRYTDCITACNKIFTEGGYTLEDEYDNLFRADNHLSNEIIFPLISDGLSSQGYGGSTFLVHATILASMDPTEFGVADGWQGLRATRNLVNQWGDALNSPDNRAMFHAEGQELEIVELTDATYGYGVTKFSNVTSDGIDGSDVTFVDTDYPMFRLGDIYLTYAEAVLRGGTGGDRATALGFINDLRTRAYGDASGNIADAELTLPFILSERSRELYFEGTRRVDLIRFGQFTTEGIWPWKGGVLEGTTVEPHLSIFPIPADDLAANPNMEQNPGYGGSD